MCIWEMSFKCCQGKLNCEDVRQKKEGGRYGSQQLTYMYLLRSPGWPQDICPV